MINESRERKTMRERERVRETQRKREKQRERGCGADKRQMK